MEINTTQSKSYWLFIILAGLFITNAVTAELISNKLIEIPNSTLADNRSFTLVFGQAQMVIIGSIIAFLTSQLLDAIVFEKIKIRTGNRFVWLRSTGSTVLSQLIDSYIVLYIGFVLPGALTIEQFLTLAPTNYILKLLIAISLTPLIYVGHYVIRKYLSEKELSN